MTRPPSQTYRVINLGCKVNRSESDVYEETFEQAGFQANAQNFDPAYIVINTCTVTGEAEKKTRKTVRRILRDYPHAQILITGCSVAIHPETYEALSERICVIPKASMENTLHELLRGSSCNTCAQDPGTSRVRKGIKIQDGCNNVCSYCIVRTARGPSHSVSATSVVAQCEDMLKAHVPEIVLTGINLGAYLDGETSLPCLLKTLTQTLPFKTTDGNLLSRIRLSSIEPQDFTEELIAAIADSNGVICRHFHLPLQAGSNKVLHEMKRRYSVEDFLHTASLITSAMPSVSLTTDVIVGFPGETEKEFQETLQVCEQVAFSKIHVFPYSPRENTAAANRPDQIDPHIKELRAQTLRTLSDKLRTNDAYARRGSSEWVVVEQTGRGRTESYHEIETDHTLEPGTLQLMSFPDSICLSDTSLP